MKRSWIKLYVEALDDPKLAELPEVLCWRFAQLLLVAGESDEGGILPTSKRLAWRLRLDQAQLLDDLRAMSEVGIVCRQGERWKVTNFEKRQASLTEAERAAQYRSRKRQGSGAAAVTKSDAAAVTDSSSPSPSQGGESAERGGNTSAEIHEAERLLLRVSRLAALPPRELPRIEQAAALAARYGPEAVERELSAQLGRWVKTVSEKTGKPYSPLNFAWVDWADAVLAGHAPPGAPLEPEPEPVFDREAYDKVEREAVPPPPGYAERLARMRAELKAQEGAL
jgi:hypothetical protein